jgi:hypothetical protein
VQPAEVQTVVGGPYSSPLGSRRSQCPGNVINWPLAGSLANRSGTHTSLGREAGGGGAWGTGRVTDRSIPSSDR